MKITTWIKTIIIVLVLIAAYYLLGKQLASVELRIGGIEVTELEQTGWGKPLLKLLVTVLVAASWTGVTALLIKPLSLEVLSGVLAVVALLLGWQAGLAPLVEFLTTPLGLVAFLVLAASISVYVFSVARDANNRVNFSYSSVSSRLNVLLLSFAALIALVFYLGIRDEIVGIDFATLLQSAKLDDFLLETANRLIPIESMQDFVTEMVNTIGEEIARLLDTGLGPYLGYFAMGVSALLFLVLMFLSTPLSWICPWIAGMLVLAMRTVGIVRVGHVTTVVKRLSLQEAESPVDS